MANQAATPELRLDDVIRFRADSDLKTKLGAVAKRRHKRLPELLRDECWKLVNADLHTDQPLTTTAKKTRRG